MGVALVVVGSFLAGGGVVVTATGEGVDNLLEVVGGLVFVLVGFDAWRARVRVGPDGVRVERPFRTRFISRKDIAGVELGEATGMYTAGQRTVVLHTHAAEAIPLLVLSRYTTANGNRVLRQQQELICAVLGAPSL
jgi:hypothetical protein